MADNVGYTPGSGATVAADDIGGVLHQRVKLTLGADGANDGDLSASNPMPIAGTVGVSGAVNVTASAPLDVAVQGTVPVTISGVSESNPLPVAAYGELIEAIEAQRFALQALTRTIGQSMPDVAGRLRVAIDAISASLTLATITTVGTVTTVTTCSTLSNQTNVGGLSATEQIPSLMRVAADSLRRNISVT